MQAGSVGVEDANQVSVDAARAVISHDHRLGKPLGLVVDRAGADRIHVAPVTLPLRMLQRITITLRGGRVQKTGAMASSDFQGICDAYRADAQGFNSQSEILRRAGRRGKVEDVIYRPQVEGSAYIQLLEAEARFMAQVREVFAIAGAEVIHADNGVALAQQAVSEVRTKKPGSAGDKYAHGQQSMLQMNLQQCVNGVSRVSVAGDANSAPTLQPLTPPACVVCLAAPGSLPGGPRSHT